VVVFFNLFSKKAEGLVLEIEKYSFLLLKKVTSFQNSNRESTDAV
jgi:hypothetical protein